jgi:hypothetical protein
MDLGETITKVALGAGENPWAKALENMRAQMQASADARRGGSKSTAGGVNLDLGKAGKDGDKGTAQRSESTIWEKIGFVTGGGGPAHDTAKNTAKSAELLSKIHDKLPDKDSQRGKPQTNDPL